MKKLPIRPLIPIVALFMAPAVMGAEPTNALQVRVGAGVEHDSNVVRQPAAESDTVGTALVGLKLDKRYGLQRFRADAEAATYRFQDHSDLNYSTINYSAAWDWSFTPRLHGVVSADRKQFRDTAFVNNANVVGRRTERNEVAEGIYELGAAWRVLAGVSHSSAESTQPNSYDASPTIRSTHVGVGYELASGASLTARLRHGNGEYTDPSVASGTFHENEADLLVRWPISGKTTVQARLGRLDRTQDNASIPNGDFSGFVGDATVTWDVTGKTRVQAGVGRDLTGSPTGGHVESNRVWLGPVWRPTVHTAVNLRYERIGRNWRDDPGNVDRHETIQAALIGFDWEPRPSLLVSTSIRNERLKSNLSFSGYRATIYGIAAKVYF